MEVLIDYGLEILVAALLAVTTWFLNSKLKLEVDGKLEGLMYDALGFGKKRAAQFLDAQVDKLEFEHAAVEEAVQMVCTEAPKWLKKAGINESFVRKKIMSMLDDESPAESVDEAPEPKISDGG